MTDRSEMTAYRVTAADVDHHLGYEATKEDLRRFEKALDHSTLSETLSCIAESFDPPRREVRSADVLVGQWFCGDDDDRWIKVNNVEERGDTVLITGEHVVDGKVKLTIDRDSGGYVMVR